MDGIEGCGWVGEVGDEAVWVYPGLVGRPEWDLDAARRDVAILHWIGRFRFVTARAIADEFGVSWQRANARLRRLERMGLVGFERQHVSQARAVFLTGRGATLLGWERHREPRASAHREHEEAIVWLVAQLERRHRSQRVLTERECRRLERQGRGGFSVEVAASARNERRRWPDVVLIDGDRAQAIEIEFAPKATERLRRIIDGYVYARRYEVLTFVVKSPVLARRLQRLAAPWGEGTATSGRSRTTVRVLPWPGLPAGER